jgi:hypothetical protein
MMHIVACISQLTFGRRERTRLMKAARSSVRLSRRPNSSTGFALLDRLGRRSSNTGKQVCASLQRIR